MRFGSSRLAVRCAAWMLRGFCLFALYPLFQLHGVRWTACFLAIPVLICSEAYVAVLAAWMGACLLADPVLAWPGLRFAAFLILAAAFALFGIWPARDEENIHRRIAVRCAGYAQAGALLGMALAGMGLFFRNTPSWYLSVIILCLGITCWALFRQTRRSWKTFLMNGVLLCVASACAFGMLELGIRFRYGTALRLNLDCWMYHPTVGRTLRPNSQGTISIHLSAKADGPMRTVGIKISSQGLRDRPCPAPVPGEIRIVVLGDSFAFGWGLEEEETISRVLERKLHERFPDRPITVLNGGVDNYGPWQEKVFLEERCLPLQPTIILHELFPGNDVENCLTRVGKFPQAYNRLAVASMLHFQHRGALPVRAEEWLQSHCMTYRFVVRSRQLDSPLASLLWRSRFSGPQPSLDLPEPAPRPFNLEPCLREEYPVLQEGWTLFQAEVMEVFRLCREKRLGYAAFTIPDVLSINDASWKWATKVVGENAYERCKDVRVTEQFLGDHAIDFVPITRKMLEYPNRNDLYYTFDGHLSPKGAELTAELLAEYLLEHHFQFR